MNRKTFADKLADLHTQYDQARDAVQQAEDVLANLTSEASSIQTTSSQLEVDRRTLLREVTSLELDLTELRRVIDQQRARQEQSAESRERIMEEMNGCQQQLETVVVPQLHQAEEEASQAESVLVAKQAQLETQRNRRRWQITGSPEELAGIRAKELSPLQADASAKEKIMINTQKQLETTKRDAEALEQALQSKTQKKDELNMRQSTLRVQMNEIRASLEGVVTERKQLWRQNEELISAVEREETVLEKDLSDLYRLVGDESGCNGIDAWRLANRSRVIAFDS